MQFEMDAQRRPFVIGPGCASNNELLLQHGTTCDTPKDYDEVTTTRAFISTHNVSDLKTHNGPTPRAEQPTNPSYSPTVLNEASLNLRLLRSV